MPITKYSYTISVEIPGGVWNSGATTRLQTLSAEQIPVQLNGVTVVQDTLTLTYADALDAAQKTVLDNNQAAPVGGILARSVETVAIKVDGILKSDNSREIVPIDGIIFKTITLQVVDGLGQDVVATDNEVVTLDPSCVCAITNLDGNLVDGQFEVVLGPDRRRGSMTLSIAVEKYPVRVLSVSYR